MLALLGRYVLLSAAVIALNFALPRLLPGDPLGAAQQSGMGGAAPLSAAQTAQLRATYHLDDPPVAQFTTYVSDLGHADLGWSISQNAPVADLILARLPWTLALVLTAVLIASIGGVVLGLASAWQPHRFDRIILASAASLAALPEVLLAMVLLLVFAAGLGWFPLSGGESPFLPADQPAGLALLDRVQHLALPALTLILANLAAFVLLSRGAVRSVLPAPYLATARAKGLDERRVAVGHAAPNAFLPVLTLFGLRLGQLFGGAIVVERVFGVPGLGLFAFQAIQARDYPVLQAIFLLASLAVLVANCGVELAYLRLEPRRGT